VVVKGIAKIKGEKTFDSIDQPFPYWLIKAVKLSEVFNLLGPNDITR
jgi:hypothetical protein